MSRSVWVRVGFCDTAHSPEFVWEAADFMWARGVRPGEHRIVPRGIEIEPHFVLQNFVRLYWGQEDTPEYVRDLTTLEYGEVLARLQVLQGRTDRGREGADVTTWAATEGMTTEERVNAQLQNLARAFGRMARGEDRVAERLPVSKRTFDFREGTSNKFWTIEVVGSTAFTTYGRIGSNGATQIKSFGSSREANRFAAKMVGEKTGKGYTERPAATHPGAPADQIEALRGPVPAPAAPAPVPARPAGTDAPVEGERNLEL